jgi:hypothetical protein
MHSKKALLALSKPLSLRAYLIELREKIGTIPLFCLVIENYSPTIEQAIAILQY